MCYPSTRSGLSCHAPGRGGAVVVAALRLNLHECELHLLLPVAVLTQVVVLIHKVHGVRVTGGASNGEAVSSWRRWRRRLAIADGRGGEEMK